MKWLEQLPVNRKIEEWNNPLKLWMLSDWKKRRSPNCADSNEKLMHLFPCFSIYQFFLRKTPIMQINKLSVENVEQDQYQEMLKL